VQAQNGVIHLVTSMNPQALHFEMNEAWILSDAGIVEQAGADGEVKSYEEKYPDGKPEAAWSAMLSNDGRYLLHGKETWWYPNGQAQYEAMFDRGRKTGPETFYTEDGVKQWSWDHQPGGASVWIQWRPNGSKKCESAWRDMKMVQAR
jgi:antitoxin component YwqK of YwqJK toxin-antitoxin module